MSPSETEWEVDGLTGRLAARTWRGGGAPSWVAVLVHGYGEHVGRYGHVAAALVDAGAVVHGVDHVGHGRSAGERVVVEDFEPVVSDVHAVVEQARAADRDLPVVVVGHSMGGMIAARYAQRYPDVPAALVLTGPVLRRWATVDALLAAPEVPDDPLDVSTLSRDPRVGEDYAADPLVWHGPFRRTTLEALHRTLGTLGAGTGFGALPVLWVRGEDDALVPLADTRDGMAVLRGPGTREWVVPGARHEVLNETNRDEVLAGITAFVAEVLG